MCLGERSGKIGLCDPTQNRTSDALTAAVGKGKVKESGVFVSDCGV